MAQLMQKTNKADLNHALTNKVQVKSVQEHRRSLVDSRHVYIRDGMAELQSTPGNNFCTFTDLAGHLEFADFFPRGFVFHL